MIIVDGHCDTITRIMEEKSQLYQNHCHIDLKRMKGAGTFVQWFAAFIDPLYCQAYAMKRAMQIIDRFYSEIERNEEHVMFCKDLKEVQLAIENGKVAALLSIEGGEALQGDLGALRMFYKLGVRSICLTWNHRNEIADGVAEEQSKGGLTPFGREVIQEMNRLGMLIDVSHLSEAGFWDVLRLSKQPIIASHSNAKKICGHRRNLDDAQIKALGKNGGMMGINLYPSFLKDGDKATSEDVIAHIEHIASIGGIDMIGLGADFDGIEKVPEDIESIKDLNKVFNGLLKRNYSEESVEKIAGGNFLRVMEKVL